MQEVDFLIEKQVQEQLKLNIWRHRQCHHHRRRRLGVEVAPPGLPLLVKPHLHLLQHLRSVADDQLDRAASLLQKLNGFLVVLAFDGHAVDGKKLVAALEASNAISNTTWKN